MITVGSICSDPTRLPARYALVYCLRLLSLLIRPNIDPLHYRTPNENLDEDRLDGDDSRCVTSSSEGCIARRKWLSDWQRHCIVFARLCILSCLKLMT